MRCFHGIIFISDSKVLQWFDEIFIKLSEPKKIFIQTKSTFNFLAEDVVKDIRVGCHTDNITVAFQTTEERFNGLIYPKGLSKNSTCMTEYINHKSKVSYVIPLRLCNTMSVDVEDGVEFFNTIVLQPHRKLVTNQGRGYHIRCRYRTEEKTLVSNFDVE